MITYVNKQLVLHLLSEQILLPDYSMTQVEKISEALLFLHINAYLSL